MKTSAILAAAAVLAVGTVGAVYFIDIDQTQEAALPDIEVTAEGGALPKYKVETGSVDVGSKEVTVEVPKVEMVEKTVTVPTVDVTPATE